MKFQDFIQKCSEVDLIFSPDGFFPLKPSQEKCLQVMYDDSHVFIRKERVVGVSTLMALSIVYDFLFNGRGDSCHAYVGHSMSSARIFARSVDFYYNRVIEKFDYDDTHLKKIKDNRTHKHFQLKGNDKKLYIYSAQNFLENSRGNYFTQLWFDDIDTWESWLTVKNTTEIKKTMTYYHGDMKKTIKCHPGAKITDIEDIMELYSGAKITASGKIPSIEEYLLQNPNSKSFIETMITNDKFKKIFLFGRPSGIGYMD